MSAILGVDVGGTFTDFFLWQAGSLSIYKRPSTPQDPSRSVLLGLEEAGFAPDEVIHGSTVATNAVLERKGARTALVTTAGFRDVLAIGRQTRPRLYEMEPRRPPPLVPDDLRVEIRERVDWQGRVLTPLDPSEVAPLLDRLEAAGAESVAVCFLFSFLHPDHERIVAEAAAYRGLFVAASHRVLPEYREYERTSTTVLNAYVGPVMARYLSRLEDGLSGKGIERLRVMLSSGGSVTAADAADLAVRTILSGPAGGVVGAFGAAGRLGFDQVITFDMGGTSTDVCLCPERIPATSEAEFGGCPVRTPVVDVHTVGAGGGSIARLDAGGALRVGPESVGADPGPACYGRGDTPTVTDAHLVLGRLLPDRFLGGRMSLSPERARRAVASLAGPFQGDVAQAAQAVVRVANASMERALRVISVERGYDPRLFTLVAFGGAGPLHACDLAELLKIPRVLVPRFPGVLSALGMVAAEPARDYSRAVIAALSTNQGFDLSGWARIESAFREMERIGQREMASEGHAQARLRLRRELDMRYRGQSYELTVPVDSLPAARQSLTPERLLRRFHAHHSRRYGHADPSRPVEAVTARVRISAPAPTLEPAPLPEGKADASTARVGEHEVWFTRSFRCPVYDRDRLLARNVVRGPALIVQMDTTIAVPPGWRGTIAPTGDLVLESQ